MFEKSAIGIFIVETPVHCGTGQDIGVVDQPLQRERHTNYPRIQGSEVKGSFRRYYKNGDVEEIFGPEEGGEEEDKYASAVSFGDVRVLFFPVKSLKGTYVWITCKDVLDKFSRTLKMANINGIAVPSVTPVDDDSIITYDSSISVNGKVVLEEYMFNVQSGTSKKFDSLVDKIVPSSAAEYSYLNEGLKKKICIISDDNFKEFTTMSTEVITRIKVDDETGVVKSGALWTEEYLPTDTILYFPVFAVKSRKPNGTLSAQNALNKVKNMTPYIQVGGNETVGKGYVRVNWINSINLNRKEE